jgi:tripartite-type tricarboxylate transporter receptor subunit TctC
MTPSASIGAALIVAAAGLGVSGPVFPQAYPAKPIRVIVPFSPGGSTDIVPRIIGHKLSESLGQQVVIDNRAGAAGVIGTELGARAAPDGYTLVMGHVGTLAMNPTLYARLPYDPLKDLNPVVMTAMFPNGLVVHPSFPAKSVKEFLAIARAKPGNVLYGSAGSGSSNHLGVVYLELLAKISLTHVPYKGGSAAIVDLVAGQIAMMMPGLPALMPHLKSGRLRMLGVSTANRTSLLPEVPTVAEAGVPGYDVTTWQGLLAPAGTPKDIVARLNSEVLKVLQLPDVKERLAAEGAEPGSTSPEQFSAHIKAEIARWAPVIKASGAKLD